jgi:DNA invertase Pin-like site-specific DNA recombinase
MIACYCRVSSHHQKSDSQKAEIIQWLKNHRIPQASVRRWLSGSWIGSHGDCLRG